MKINKVSHRPRTVLHLGIPKTVTTLEHCLFAKHSEIESMSANFIVRCWQEPCVV